MKEKEAIVSAKALKNKDPKSHISFVGSHTSALPKEVLSLPHVDTVLLNEGVYALRNLLNKNEKVCNSD